MNILHGICFASVGLILTTGIAVAGGGPLADAGLDQSVSSGTTVQLDATGSTHPDGEIESYEWHIETPDGREIAPECPSCGRTTFTPETSGTYAVSVTVTDDDGVTANDTLYVHVEGASNGGVNESVTDDSNSLTRPNQEPKPSSNDKGPNPIEVNYSDSTRAPECIHDGSQQTGAGYTGASRVDTCEEADGAWNGTAEEIGDSATQVTIEVDNYRLENSGNLLPSGTPQVPLAKNSEGMGQQGHLNPRVEAVREAGSETGTVERILFGEESTEAITYTTTGESAHTTANLDSLNTQYHDDIGQSQGTTAGFENVEQTSGPNGEELANADQAVVTIKKAEGEGVLDHLGVTDAYSRTDYQNQRSGIVDFTREVSSTISDTVETGSRLIGSNGEKRTSSDTSTRDTSSGTTGDSSPNDVSSDLSSKSDDPSNADIGSSRSSQDDTSSYGGHTTDKSSSSSSVESSGSSSGMDWQLPDDLGSDNTAGYATSTGI